MDEARPFGIVRLLGTQTTGVEKQFLDRLDPSPKRIKPLKDRKGDSFGKHSGMKYLTSFAKSVKDHGKTLGRFALGI